MPQDSVWADLSSSVLSLAHSLGEAKPDISFLNFSVKEVQDFFDCAQPKKWLKAEVNGTLFKLFPRFRRREDWDKLDQIGREFCIQLKAREETLDEVLFENKSRTLWLRVKGEPGGQRAETEYCDEDECYLSKPCSEHSTEGKSPAPFKKDFFRPSAITEDGIEAAIAVMRTGRLCRYTATSAKTSHVAQAEKEFATYVGRKYCVAVNSCSSAILLALISANVQCGDQVFCNGFTFTSVPASIVRAGAVPVLVDTHSNWTMDLSDLERKAELSPHIKVLLLSHMRGKVADMDALVEICQRRSLLLIEDCAHACGVKWEKKQVGYHSFLAVYSTQSDKVINSGEGGFIVTDDDAVCAKLIYLSGAYERRYLKHALHPPANMCEEAMLTQPNLSMRMSELTAAVLRPQIRNLEERIVIYNRKYDLLLSLISHHPNLIVPDQDCRVTHVGDHLVFHLEGVDEQQSDMFVATSCKLGVPVAGFVSNVNARWHVNWRKFGVPSYDLPQTHALLWFAYDLKLPPQFEDEDISHIATILLYALDFALANENFPSQKRSEQHLFVR